jgi:hypothetical protein
VPSTRSALELPPEMPFSDSEMAVGVVAVAPAGGVTGEAKSRQWSRLSRHSESASRLGPPYPIPNPIEPLQKLVRLKLEGRLPRSPRSPQSCPLLKTPLSPAGFLFGRSGVDGPGLPGGGRSTGVSGVTLHSFQNGMVSVRVPGATAPLTLCWCKALQPPAIPRRDAHCPTGAWRKRGGTDRVALAPV